MEIQKVYAVGTAVGHGTLNTPLGQKILAAQTAAVRKAQAEGISDPDEIRRRIVAARDAVRGY